MLLSNLLDISQQVDKDFETFALAVDEKTRKYPFQDFLIFSSAPEGEAVLAHEGEGVLPQNTSITFCIKIWKDFTAFNSYRNSVYKNDTVTPPGCIS